MTIQSLNNNAILKKKPDMSYSTDTYKKVKELSLPVQFAITIVGVVVVILNLWAVSKLAPVYENIAVITTRVNAFEAKSNNLIDRNEFGILEKRLDRIEGKVDRLFERK